MGWIKGRQKNKRCKRSIRLHVKAQEERVKSARMRVAGTVMAAALGVTLVVLFFWKGGSYAIDRLLLNNEAFAIKKIEVNSDGVIPHDRILQWSGVTLGDNLLGADLARIKRDLELAPLVKFAAVERVLPNTLRLRIVERRPLAQVYALQPVNGRYDTVIYQIDSEGYVLPPVAVNVRSADPKRGRTSMPILTSMNGTDLAVGRRVSSPQVVAALRFIDEFTRSPMMGVVDLRHIDVGSPEALRVFTRQGSEVTFALNRLDWQLRRWRTVHDAATRIGQSIATLDLSVTNNLPVRWQQVEQSPPAPSAPSGTPNSRARRKHA